MWSLNIEDIETALRDLSEVLKRIAYVFLLPLPFSVYTVLLKDLYGGFFRFDETLTLLGDMPIESFMGMMVNIFLRCMIFIVPAAISYVLYAYFGNLRKETSTRTLHVMIGVAVGWMIISIIGAIPFLLSGALSPLDSWFESMSGWSTTGLSMIRDVEAAPKDILFYRSLMQWVGGIGIVVIALSVFMRKGTIALDYYSSERGTLKIKPSIRGTVNEIWKIYGVYTITCFILLNIAGMGLFDSINHSMVTLATGGFSTHNASIGFFHDKPLIEFISIVFMLVGAVSFFIHFRIFEGDVKYLSRNIEFRYMATILAAASVCVFATLYLQLSAVGEGFNIFEDIDAFRAAVFQSVSAMSCTGLSTTDLSSWPEIPQIILVLLMYVGGIYGSTAGGIKLLRLIVILEVVAYTMKKMSLPKTAMIRMKLGEKAIGETEIFTAVGLSAAYLAVASFGILLLTIFDYGIMQSLFLTFSAMGNVGLVNVPMEMWYNMSDLSKITLCLLMWIGRLEIFPVIVLAGALFKRAG